MNILLAHNRYQLAGGEDAVVQAEAKLLQSYGHEVQILEVDNSRIVKPWDKAKAAISTIYSFDSKRLVTREITKLNADIVHVHNFFPLLSPAVYDACLDKKVPVVQTLHNYRLACPKAMPFREGKICENCIGRAIPIDSIIYGCYRSSRTQSAAVAAMLAFHHWHRTWQDKVNAYVVLTNFQKQLMIRAGLPEAKIYIKPNFVFSSITSHLVDKSTRYGLFVGRLSEEKGAVDLIDAYSRGGLNTPIKIIGDGPLCKSLKQRVKQLGLEHIITFLGWQGKETVLELMRNATFLVFPSIWYEGFPLTIAEAFSCSLPVIAPKLGSMAEIVQDNVTGLHFEARNPVDLAVKIQWAQANYPKIDTMGRTARTFYETNYTSDVNYRQLLNIYQQAMQPGSNPPTLAKARS